MKHYESSVKKVKEVAEALGIPVSTLNGWIKEYSEHGDKSFPGSGNIKPCNEEYYTTTMKYWFMQAERKAFPI